MYRKEDGNGRIYRHRSRTPDKTEGHNLQTACRKAVFGGQEGIPETHPWSQRGRGCGDGTVPHRWRHAGGGGPAPGEVHVQAFENSLAKGSVPARGQATPSIR
ncbi:MAG: hypothetical protein MZU79_00265 [Anaerotruncus sp.]|nr:hypothetical protein [Anaerotruncus sp.]